MDLLLDQCPNKPQCKELQNLLDQQQDDTSTRTEKTSMSTKVQLHNMEETAKQKDEEIKKYRKELDQLKQMLAQQALENHPTPNPI